jgi:hypothetical protein
MVWSGVNRPAERRPVASRDRRSTVPGGGTVRPIVDDTYVPLVQRELLDEPVLVGLVPLLSRDAEGKAHFVQIVIGYGLSEGLTRLSLPRTRRRGDCNHKGPRMNNLSDPRAVRAGHDGVTAQTILAQALTTRPAWAMKWAA